MTTTTAIQKQTTRQSNTASRQSEPKGIAIQAKLTVGQPNDQYEQEADRIADQVMRMPDRAAVQRKCTDCEEEKVQQKPLAARITPWVQRQAVEEQEENLVQGKFLQRQPEEEEGAIQPKRMLQRQTMEEEEPIQTKSPNSESATPGASLESRLNSSKSGGQSLPENTRSFMEERIGADFSKVKVHTDSNAVQMSQELGAQAFTHGNHIYFNAGKYSPESNSGKHLLAHEMVHTLHQGGSNLVHKKDLINKSVSPPVKNSIVQSKPDSKKKSCDIPSAINYYEEGNGKRYIYYKNGKPKPLKEWKGWIYELSKVARGKYNHLARIALTAADRGERVSPAFVKLICAAQRHLGVKDDGIIGGANSKTMRAYKKWKKGGIFSGHVKSSSGTYSQNGRILTLHKAMSWHSLAKQIVPGGGPIIDKVRILRRANGDFWYRWKKVIPKGESIVVPNSSPAIPIGFIETTVKDREGFTQVMERVAKNSGSWEALHLSKERFQRIRKGIEMVNGVMHYELKEGMPVYLPEWLYGKPAEQKEEGGEARGNTEVEIKFDALRSISKAAIKEFLEVPQLWEVYNGFKVRYQMNSTGTLTFRGSNKDILKKFGFEKKWYKVGSEAYLRDAPKFLEKSGTLLKKVPAKSAIKSSFKRLGKSMAWAVPISIVVDSTEYFFEKGVKIDAEYGMMVGKSAAKAGISAASAIGASMAFGAAFGSVIPGLGTAVGILVGIAVGVFLDWLWP